MGDTVNIVCEKFKSDDRLLWFNSRKKWKVHATNHLDQPIFLAWSEVFFNPFTHELWIEKIDESPTAGDRMIVEGSNLSCTSFLTSGSEQHLVPPDRFLQLAINAGETATWVMERIRLSHWSGFNVYDRSLVDQLKSKEVPNPVENIFPKIKGWPWS